MTRRYIKGLEGCCWAMKCVVKGCESPVIGLGGLYCAKHRKETKIPASIGESK